MALSKKKKIPKPITKEWLEAMYQWALDNSGVWDKYAYKIQVFKEEWERAIAEGTTPPGPTPPAPPGIPPPKP